MGIDIIAKSVPAIIIAGTFLLAITCALKENNSYVLCGNVFIPAMIIFGTFLYIVLLMARSKR